MEKTTFLRKTWNLTQGFGAFCGIAVTIFTLWSLINKPKPPELWTRFALTESSSLSFAINASSTDNPNWNQPLPVGLLISNTGGTATEDAVLRLIHPTYLQISAKTIQINQQEIYIGNQLRTMTTIQLPSIHPGETLHFDKGLYVNNYDPTKESDKAFVEVDQNTIELMLSPKDNTPPSIISISSDAGPDIVLLPPPKTYEIEARISAKNLPEKRTSLYITVGPLEELKKNKEPLFIIAPSGNLFKSKQ